MQHEITAIVPQLANEGDDSEQHLNALEAFEYRLDIRFGGFTRVDGRGSWAGGHEEVYVYRILVSMRDARDVADTIDDLQNEILREFIQRAAYVTAREVTGGIRYR